MKKTLFLLLALGLMPMAQAQGEAPAAKAEQQAELSTPEVSIRKRDGLYEGHVIHIDFSEPMVAESEVNQPAKAEQLPTITPALEVDAVWESTSSLALRLKKAAALRTPYTLELPAGLTSTNGTAMPGLRCYMARENYCFVNASQEDDQPEAPVFFAAHSPEDDALVASVVDKAYAARWRDGETVETFPVKVRHATVADALAHWDCYRVLADDTVTEKDRKAFQEAAPETPLPNVWLCDGFVVDSANERVVLALPGLGSFDDTAGVYTDLQIQSCSLPDYQVYLEARHFAEGQYQLTITPNQPFAETDPAKAFAATRCVIETFDYVRLFSPVPREGAEGVLKPDAEALAEHPELAEFCVTPDYEATAATLQSCPSGGDEGRKGLGKLVLKVRIGPHCAYLSCSPNLPSVYGAEPQPAWLGEQPNYWPGFSLYPDRPVLTCSVMASGLRSEGTREIQYHARDLSKLVARVFHVNTTGSGPARMLRAYAKQYMRIRNQENGGRAWEKELRKADKTTLFNTDGLLIDMVEKELPLDKETGSFDPSGFSPSESRHGVYFVELIGTPKAPEWGDMKMVAQGLVQMTDLGLMWKRSARSLFAYAYRLSDAAPLPEGSLHVLDIEGRELASFSVAEGLAKGDLPEGAAFLQLRSGDDAYTTRIAQDDDLVDGYWDGGLYELESLGLNPSEFPETSLFMFSDRSVYRPGETLNVKGIIRSIRGDDVLVPRVKSLTLKLDAGGVEKEIPATVEADGTFALSIPLEGCALDDYACLSPVICFEGDAEMQAPDHLFLKEHGLKLDSRDDENERYNTRQLLASNRKPQSFCFRIADYRRNEFELKGDIHHEGERVSMDVSATAFTGVPVSHGRVSWVLNSCPASFLPEKYCDYSFGDDRDGLGYYFSRYSRETYSDGDSLSLRRSDALDAQGLGKVEFELPEEEFPGRRTVSVTASVTNGNEQTLRCTRRVTIDSSAVYPGLCVPGRLTEADTAIPLDAVLVNADESDYTGEPIRCEVAVTRRIFRSYRYGADSLTAVHNTPEEAEVYRGELMVGGQPTRLDIPATGPGIYDIVLRGRDANGKAFACAHRQYVWGGSDISPWSYEDGEALTLIADRESYKVGDTAHILVQTPVDAELLVTMERGGVRREFKRSVTVDKPVIDIPLEAGDGPSIHVSVFLVQKEEGRSATGLPLVKVGSTEIHVDVPEKRLDIDLQLPDTAPLAGFEWTVGGSVKAADGNPVANASVALYAVDEGTLQVLGYTLPDPFGHFYGSRPRGVQTYTTEGQLVSDSLDNADFGNKGVFIGGGGSVAGDDTAPNPRLRENFSPCALWLGNAHTDAEGRFTATYVQPDSMTRYRLMAVVAADDRFGAKQTQYSVVQPVMLEPVVPSSAAAGDRLDMPVTLSMLPESLPGGQRDEVSWTISLAGENAELPEATRTVTLKGKEPTTVTLPVVLNAVGDSRLTWTVKAEDPALAGVADAVALNFRVVPPTPYLRERFYTTLKSGSNTEPSSWFKAKLRPDAQLQAILSTTPFVGASAGCDFLFRYPYGCLEQTSSTLLPWLFMEQLEKGLDISFPTTKKRDKVLAEGIRSLLRRRRDDGHFAYWDSEAATSEFSAYAVLTLCYAGDSLLSSTQRYQLRRSISTLKDALKESADTPLLGVLTLALAGKLTVEEFDAIMQMHEHLHTDEGWAVAAAARLIGHPKADAILAAVRKGKDGDCSRYMMPPVEACRLLELVVREPKKEETTQAVRNYLSKGVDSGRFNSTWQAGWLCIVMHEYLNRCDAGEASRPRHVNGTEVTDGHPLRLAGLLGDTGKMEVRDGTLYVGGIVEGYERNAQPNSIVNKGFRVERRYEKLMPDGSWQPTAEFTVGDVVRVTLTADGKLGSYMLVEDRLPAAFETINPTLPSQSLPPGVAERTKECWHVPGWIDHTEYELGRVRFFASSWFGGEALTVSYIARVVRSGEVTAPAARAEFMYRPEVYGLSVPQSFTVKPRP